MKSLSRFAVVFLLIAGYGLPAWAQATAEAPPQQETETSEQQEVNEEWVDELDIGRFMRVRRDASDNPVAMETSITRYVTTNSDGERVTVDLIGVVHIGEKDYYEELNELFAKYDALLYELVAPEGTVIPRGGRSESAGMNPVAVLQQSLQSVLGLEFQLEHIDYTVDNFVHADMTPEEFGESMEENDESFFKMALKAFGQSMAMQSSNSELSDASLLMAMFSSDREMKLRRIMASQMQDMESGMVIFEGRDGSTIIHHRNRKALQIMHEQIESGKTRLGIFYGAGHLPDFDEHLRKSHGMKRGGQFWLEAWDLR
ncbi:MAG: hypothetical protein ACR2NP_17560 [Pirellulaceae bacterium]